MAAGPGSAPGPASAPTRPIRTSPAPAMRALLVALEQWVTEGHCAAGEPRADACRRQRRSMMTTVKFPAVKGVTLVRTGNQLRPARRLERPAGCARRWSLPHWPARRSTAPESRPWTPTATKPPASGLPPIAVPLATYTGWNLYARLPSELCDRDGTYIPFAKTKAEREAANRSAPVDRGALRRARRLCREGEGGGGCAGARPAAAAGRRGGLCARRGGERPVLRSNSAI